MKHLHKFVAGAAVLVLLTGCDLFKHSISAEEYQKKVDKLEAHQYSEATVTVKEVITGTGMYAESNVDTEETGKLIWNEVKGEWEPDEESDSSLKYYVYTLQGKKVTDVINLSVSSNLEVKTTYYSNLEAKVDIKGSVTVPDMEMEVKYDKYQANYKFDKYGYITSYKVVCNSSTTMGTQSGTHKETRTIKVSYK